MLKYFSNLFNKLFSHENNKEIESLPQKLNNEQLIVYLSQLFNYQYCDPIKITLNEHIDQPKIQIPSKWTAKDVIKWYELNEDALPLIDFVSKLNEAEQEVFFKEWYYCIKIKKNTINPVLQDLLYSLILKPKLTKTLIRIIYSLNFKDYKHFFIELLILPEIDIEFKNLIIYFTNHIELSPIQINLFEEWLIGNDTEYKSWAIKLLINSKNADKTPILNIFSKYLKATSEFNISIIKFLAQFGNKDHLNWVKQGFDFSINAYFEDSKDYGVSEFILGYAQIAGKNSISDLQNIYNQHQFYAIQALGIAAKDTKNKELVTWMLQNYKDQTIYHGKKYKYHLTIAIQKIMNQTDFNLTKHLYSNEEINDLQVFLKTYQLNFSELIIELKKIKLIDERFTESQLIEGHEEELFFSLDDKIIFLLKNAEILVNYDAEEGGNPINYVSLIELFAKNSNNKFNPSNIKQKNLKIKVKEVSFCWLNYKFTFNPYHNEDWIDVSTVIAAINHSVLLGNSENYFVPIRTYGQNAMYIWGDLEKVNLLQEKFNFMKI